MNGDKSDPSKKDVATVSGELTEEQLNSVSGGGSKTTNKHEYLVITMTAITVTNVSTY
jgi:bacteriocin-like protein